MADSSESIREGITPHIE